MALCQPPSQRIHTQETARIARRRRSRQLAEFPNAYRRWQWTHDRNGLCQQMGMATVRPQLTQPYLQTLTAKTVG